MAGGAHRVGPGARARPRARPARTSSSATTARPGAAEQTRAEIAALGAAPRSLRADAAGPSEMRTMVDAGGRRAGRARRLRALPVRRVRAARPAEQIDEPLWDAAMDSTAKGFMFAAQAAYRVMREAGGGVIVAITDVAGLQPWPRFAPHGAAKAAQIHLVKCLAAAWGRDGVRVCGVAPGPVLMPEGVAREPRRDGARPARRPGRRGPGRPLLHRGRLRHRPEPDRGRRPAAASVGRPWRTLDAMGAVEQPVTRATRSAFSTTGSSGSTAAWRTTSRW